nr:PREDICTED: uncharacterized protein LOC108953539 [Musa acuminata subsp. malaccensis]
MPEGGECGRQQLWVRRECFGKEMAPLFIVLKGVSHLSLPVISSAGGDAPSWVPSMDGATAHVSTQVATLTQTEDKRNDGSTPFSIKAKRWEGEREDGVEGIKTRDRHTLSQSNGSSAMVPSHAK